MKQRQARKIMRTLNKLHGCYHCVVWSDYSIRLFGNKPDSPWNLKTLFNARNRFAEMDRR